MTEPFLRERLLERFARWRARRSPRAAVRIMIPIGSRVYIGGHLDVEGELVSLTDDRILATVVDDEGQAHWADARRLYRLP